MRFFFYGTLIDPDVRDLVLGRHAPRLAQQAKLSGWRCAPVPGKTYPTIVPQPRGTVRGIVIRGLDTAAQQKLVRYEDAFYEMREVEVDLVDRRRRILAVAFVARAGRTASAVRGWDFADWRRRHKRRFMQRLRRRGGAA